MSSIVEKYFSLIIRVWIIFIKRFSPTCFTYLLERNNFIQTVTGLSDHNFALFDIIKFLLIISTILRYTYIIYNLLYSIQNFQLDSLKLKKTIL